MIFRDILKSLPNRDPMSGLQNVQTSTFLAISSAARPRPPSLKNLLTFPSLSETKNGNLTAIYPTISTEQEFARLVLHCQRRFSAILRLGLTSFRHLKGTNRASSPKIPPIPLWGLGKEMDHIQLSLFVVANEVKQSDGIATSLHFS